MKAEQEILLEIMESLLAGSIDCGSAQEKVDALSMKEFPELYGNLYHYYNDEDSRGKDSEYKAFQNSELEKLIRHLKAGEIEKANGVSFLHES